MKWIIVMLALFAAAGAAAQDRSVEGTITYLAQGMVYTSLGRDSGLEDSALVAVVTQTDTVAVLKVFALSSKSSACTIVRARRALVVGDRVLAAVKIQAVVLQPQRAGTADSSARVRQAMPGPQVAGAAAAPPGPVDVKGRISLQYFGSSYDTHAFDFAQSGVVINLRGQARDLPLRFEMYGNFRTLSFGTTSPFARGGRNQSRVYRMSLEYQDGPNDVVLGRIIPMMAPMTGYIDGALLARTFGDFTIGVAGGYQPNLLHAGVTTDYKKAAVLARYQIRAPINLTASAAYERTYYLQQLDRESASTQVIATITDRWFVFGIAEMDMRRKLGDVFQLHPALSQMTATVNYRVNENLTVGGGADASRPVYPFSLIRGVPDSLLDRRLRSGGTLNFMLSLAGGVSLYNTYNPRAATPGARNEYANTTQLNAANLFASGVNLRSNYTLGSNAYTQSRGYGFALQRNFVSMLDLTLRYQRNIYSLFATSGYNRTNTTGLDFLFSVTRTVSLMGTYERLISPGANSNQLFGEFSVRL